MTNSACSTPSKKLVHGWGINDSESPVTWTENEKRKRCPYYQKWAEILHRVKYQPSLELEPTYKKVSISPEWQRFSSFKRWMKKQNWHGKELDKDILSGAEKIYSPETCCFIDHELNMLICMERNTPRHLPVGVYAMKQTKKYMAACRFKGKSRYIGLFETVHQARHAYLEYKAILIKKYAYQQPDKRIAEGLLRHAEILLEGQ